MTLPISSPLPLPGNGAERIAIVDSQHAARLGLAQFLTGTCGLEIAWTVATAEEALVLAERNEPDLLITEIALSGMDGLSMIREILPAHPEIKILVHSLHSEEFYAERCLKAGAMGYLHKTDPLEELRIAVDRILHGEIHVNPRLGRQVFRTLVADSLHGGSAAGTPGMLTDRELEVILLMADGAGSKEIAARLGISTKTVHAHRNNIRVKLGLESVLQLQAHAVRFYSPEGHSRQDGNSPNKNPGCDPDFLGSETLRRFLERYP